MSEPALGDAITKALDIAELLELILGKLSVHDRLPLLGVSKKRNFITSSIGCVVKPVEHEISLFKHAGRCPRYVIDRTLRVNPAINSFAAAVMEDGNPAHKIVPKARVTMCWRVSATLPNYCRSGRSSLQEKWNNLVMDLGIHLEPLFVDDQLGVPFYSDDIRIRRNAWASCYQYQRQDKMAAELQVPYFSLTQMECNEMMYYKRSEFLRDPPISTLGLQVIGPLGSSIRPMHAILRTATRTMEGSGGIRCGDLLDVFDKMRAYDTTLSLVGWDFAGWYATNGDEVDYEHICERASTKSGIEVRKCTGNGE